ncbi:MAG: hypothetical protein IH988_10250 [Planctomycetes bacterium]|nr:hypothetical protein [Planctomycetota bacterium]
MFLRFVASFCSLAVASVHAQVVAYEGTSFPETEGWDRDTFCEPERWLEADQLFQQVDLDPCPPGPNGGRDSYSRSLSDFAGQSTFFVEWCMQTDGDSSEIDGTAPALLSAGGFSGVLYHFTIAKDQVRFLRDTLLPILWIDIEPEVAHTYRLELFGPDLYVWYIDSELIDWGVPEGAYPSEDATIDFRAKAWYLESTTQWDYIRYGTIPEPGSGDFDSDDDVDLDDYYFFQDCVTGPNIDAGPGCVWADFDGDSDVDLIDFGHFQANFTGPAD